MESKARRRSQIGKSWPASAGRSSTGAGRVRGGVPDADAEPEQQRRPRVALAVEAMVVQRDRRQVGGDGLGAGQADERLRHDVGQRRHRRRVVGAAAGLVLGRGDVAGVGVDVQQDAADLAVGRAAP